MSVHHHPDYSMLVGYAAGSISEPLALLVASHLSFCRACQSEAAELDEIGGALLGSVSVDEEDVVAASVLDEMLERLDDTSEDDLAAARSPAPIVTGDPRLPGALRPYVAGDLEALPWTRRAPGLSEVELLSDNPLYRTRLLRIEAGAAMPKHTHAGSEHALVLSGGFTDTTGHFGPGDVAVSDREIDHRPVADPDEPCYCLIVIEGDLHLTGPIGRYLNGFVRF